MVNLPNKITVLRMALIPVFLIVLSLDIPFKEWIATVVFVVLALGDSLDGYLARKRNEVTEVGKFIDPLADKLLVSAALIFLIGNGVSAWMAWVIIAREFAVTGLRILAASKKIIIQASNLGKLKTWSQGIGIIAVLLNLSIAWWLMLIAVLFTIISALDYFLAAKKLMKE